MSTPNASSSGSKKGASAPDPKAEEPVKTGLAVHEKPKPLGLAVSTYDAEDLGAGFENITQDELAVPFIVILQKGSPQCEEGNPRAIVGAKPGMLMNTVTNKLYDGKEGIRFIPVVRERNFIEWIPRDDGGGFVGLHAADAPEVREALKAAGRKFGKLKIGDNNDLVETCSLFGLLLAPDSSFERVIIAFASTQIGTYKRIVTMGQSVQLQQDDRVVVPPLFAHVYRLRTEFTTKNNYTWYKWLGGFDGPDAAAARIDRTDPLYEQAKLFRAMLQSGAAKAAYETTQQEHTEVEGGGENSGYAM